MNYYNVSTKEALEAGRMNLKYIPYGILGLTGLAMVWYVWYMLFNERKNDFGELNDDVAFPGLVFLVPAAGYVLSVVWRNLHSAAWKIYVLENVQDVHRAFKLAESEGMIFGPGSLLNKLEYRSVDQREKLSVLETRLSEPRQFEAATGTPVYEEQSFRYAFRMAAGQSLTIVGFFAGIYFFTQRESAELPPIVFLVPIGIMAFLAYRWVPRFNGPPPIRFDARQLTLGNNPPVLWKDVTDLYTEKRSSGKSTIPWLVVKFAEGGVYALALNEIDGSPAEIEDTLYQHWAIAKKQASNPS